MVAVCSSLRCLFKSHSSLQKYNKPLTLGLLHTRAASTKMNDIWLNGSASHNRRVLAIQSHVVHGYVGNKSATFPLQVLGFEVDAINSVQFSNHTGYNYVKGQVLNERELNEVFMGLEQNHLLDSYSHVLTGYIGNESFLHKTAEILRAIRKVNPTLTYVCDPVLGDNGHLYVPKSLIPVYQQEILPLCDICTPNQFEAETLSGIEITSEANAWKALDWFHDKGIPTVVLSSTNFSPNDNLIAFLSQKNGTEVAKYTLKMPLIGNGIIFTGVGDLFAALFLAHSSTKPKCKALELTVATLRSVLRNTLNAIPAEHRSPDKVTARQRELKLVQSKSDIENPQVEFYAKKVE